VRKQGMPYASSFVLARLAMITLSYELKTVIFLLASVMDGVDRIGEERFYS
jgi:hypothetical protein